MRHPLSSSSISPPPSSSSPVSLPSLSLAQYTSLLETKGLGVLESGIASLLPVGGGKHGGGLAVAAFDAAIAAKLPTQERRERTEEASEKQSTELPTSRASKKGGPEPPSPPESSSEYLAVIDAAVFPA
ncbi:uncharacterized protein G2W53_037407 [Senna tora]|uniref:Uncharacterized protein n=1 Tax=Senna tora TaxID=362788 RepID=A0A834WB26_9FABA|nr:uncharacterized protein G2W53_037407 [Senna tora]